MPLHILATLSFTLALSPLDLQAAWFKKTPCSLILRRAVDLGVLSAHKKLSGVVQPEEIGRIAERERRLGKDEKGLAYPISSLSALRSPEKVKAWLTHISDRLKALRDTGATMNVTEFMGLVDAGFGQRNFELSKLFEKYGIKNIRFVDGKKFQSEKIDTGFLSRLPDLGQIPLSEEAGLAQAMDPFILGTVNKTKIDKDELVLSLPDFPVDNAPEAALWIFRLNKVLHDIATHDMAMKLAEKSPTEAGTLWKSTLKNELTELNEDFKKATLELDQYLKSETGTYTPDFRLAPWILKTPQRLADRVRSAPPDRSLTYGDAIAYELPKNSLGSNPWYVFRSGLKVVAAAPVIGAPFQLPALLLGRAKVPLDSFSASSSLLTQLPAEHHRIAQRMKAYVFFRHYDKWTTRINTTLAVGALTLMGVKFAQKNSPTDGVQDGLTEEKNIDELNGISDEILKKLERPQLEKKYKDYLALEKQAALKSAAAKSPIERQSLLSQASKYAEQANRLNERLQTFSQDGDVD